MNIQLLLCSALIASQLLYSQAPKGPGGNSLYKKGDCERAGVDFNVCTYCEDKELTKNCKEYWCTDNGTCSEAPFKKPNTQVVRTNVEGAKYIAPGKDDTTSKLPPGVKYVNGRVTIQSGYKAVFSSDKKIVFILRSGNNVVKGTFSCACGSSGSCILQIIGNAMVCAGAKCCALITTLESLTTPNTMQGIEEAPEKLTWKKIVVPTKSN